LPPGRATLGETSTARCFALVMHSQSGRPHRRDAHRPSLPRPAALTLCRTPAVYRHQLSRRRTLRRHAFIDAKHIIRLPELPHIGGATHRWCHIWWCHTSVVPHLVVPHIGGATSGGATHRWCHIGWCHTSVVPHLVVLHIGGATSGGATHRWCHTSVVPQLVVPHLRRDAHRPSLGAASAQLARHLRRDAHRPSLGAATSQLDATLAPPPTRRRPPRVPTLPQPSWRHLRPGDADRPCRCRRSSAGATSAPAALIARRCQGSADAPPLSRHSSPLLFSAHRVRSSTRCTSSQPLITISEHSYSISTLGGVLGCSVAPR
jgi:hypothetical protein